MPLFGPPNISAMQSRGDVSGLIRALKYDSDSGEVRQAAVQALGSIGLPALQALIQACKSSESQVRYGSAQALGLMDHPDAVRPLVQCLADPHDAVRRAAAEALAGMTLPAALQALSQTAAGNHTASQAAAIQAIGTTAGEKGIPILINLLGAEYHQPRMAAAEALERIGDSALPALIYALQHSDENTRRAAVVLLGSMRSEKALPALMEALRDPSEYVRLAAEDALKACGELAIVPLLRLYFTGEDELRPLAGRVIIKMEGLSHEALLTALKQGSPEVRVQAARLLAQFGQDWTIQPLADLLTTPEVELRFLAVKGLSRTGGLQVAPHLLRALTDEDPYVQDEARKALEYVRQDVKDPTLMRQIDQAFLNSRNSKRSS